MRQFIFLVLVIPFAVQAQNKNIVNALRVFPKTDKTSAFEKALAHHAQTYHKGDAKWRVFSIESGPDFGGYHITEGPTSWDALDKRGEISQAHTDDWAKNIAPLLTDRGSSMYSSYREDLSTIALTNYSDKISISHWYVNVGYRADTEELIAMLKKMWEKGGETIAVYQSESSGETQFALVSRYKNGLVDRTMNSRPLKERFEEANGSGSWDKYIKGLRVCVGKISSEILFYNAKISSMN